MKTNFDALVAAMTPAGDVNWDNVRVNVYAQETIEGDLDTIVSQHGIMYVDGTSEWLVASQEISAELPQVYFAMKELDDTDLRAVVILERGGGVHCLRSEDREYIDVPSDFGPAWEARNN